MDISISQTAALRIALASKLLPSIDLQALLGSLIQHLGPPVTEQKLQMISPKSFRVIVSALDNSLSRKEVTSALAMLTNQTLGSLNAPKVVDQVPLSGPKLRVAITSNQDQLLNGHFGTSLRVLIYEVNASSYQLVDVLPVGDDLKGEQRTEVILSLIKGCQILFTLSIGGPAAAKVTRAYIHPVKKLHPVDASEVLTELSKVIANNPPPWIQKALDGEV
ncbi:NifB/NifX family molybdenum-iron cluster-binding protein [Vibrio sp. M260118]|uniref:NifB/NifX family molybdenum-iron cluster-binding protein n=1 Tax=Vibrio sp. M260118 TaxID=3020896 RepID=UPI002F404794